MGSTIKAGWDARDEVLDESFPASDPPANSTHAGPPDPWKDTAPHGAASGAHRMRERLEPTSGEALRFDLSAEAAGLRSEQPWQVGRNAKTLVKYPDFRLVLIAMRAGARMKGHHADGRISIQALRGRLRLHLPDQVVDLGPGELLALDYGVAHDVEALEESEILLTIAWPGLGHGRRSSAER